MNKVDLADKNCREAKENWEKLDKLASKKWVHYCKKIDSESGKDTVEAAGAVWVQAAEDARKAHEISQDMVTTLRVVIASCKIENSGDEVIPNSAKSMGKNPYWEKIPFQSKKIWLTDIGIALFGPMWKSDLARELGVGNTRIGQWLTESGQVHRPMPENLPERIYEICERRKSEIERVQDQPPVMPGEFPEV